MMISAGGALRPKTTTLGGMARSIRAIANKEIMLLPPFDVVRQVAA